MAPTHRVSSLRGLLAFGWRLGLLEPSGELHKCFWMFFLDVFGVISLGMFEFQTVNPGRPSLAAGADADANLGRILLVGALMA